MPKIKRNLSANLFWKLPATLLLFVSLFFVFPVLAQDSTTVAKPYMDETDLTKIIKGKNPKKPDTGIPAKGKLMAFAAPVFGSNPSLGTFFGLGATGAIYLGSPENTNISNMIAVAQVTTKSQFIASIKGTLMTSENDWEMLIDLKYSIFSEGTYGLGSDYNQPIQESWNFGGFQNSGVSGAQPLNYSYWRMHFTALRETADHLYVGIGYHLDYHYKIVDQLLDLEAPEPVITSHYYYSFAKGYEPQSYFSSGTSVNVLYDSRDHTMNPYKGSFLQASYRINTEWMGSTQNYQQLYLEARLYKALSQKMPRHLIAFWAIGSFITSGEAPYLDLPSSSSDMRNRIGRGYVASRFRGKEWVTAETEYRFPITKNGLLGGVVFASATTTSREQTVVGENTFDQLKLFEAIRPAGGFGARLMLKRAGRMNLSMDMAFGQNGAKGFYFAVGETF
jgi:hypothetical protein